MLRVAKILICILYFGCIRSNGSEYNIIIVFVLLFFPAERRRDDSR